MIHGNACGCMGISIRRFLEKICQNVTFLYETLRLKNSEHIFFIDYFLYNNLCFQVRTIIKDSSNLMSDLQIVFKL